MGILAKKDMLYILTFCVAISLLTQALIFADDRGLGFFEEGNTHIQTEDCEPCIKEEDELNSDLKKKTEDIEKRASASFTDKEKKQNSEIILFVDPDHPFSDGAVNTLVKFKKDNPGWKAKGVIIADLRGLKEKLFQKRNYFGSGIEFAIDLTGNLAREFNVTRTPTYVIIHHGRLYRIAGQPDLKEVLSKLDK